MPLKAKPRPANVGFWSAMILIAVAIIFALAYICRNLVLLSYPTAFGLPFSVLPQNFLFWPYVVLTKAAYGAATAAAAATIVLKGLSYLHSGKSQFSAFLLDAIGLQALAILWMWGMAWLLTREPLLNAPVLIGMTIAAYTPVGIAVARTIGNIAQAIRPKSGHIKEIAANLTGLIETLVIFGTFAAMQFATAISGAPVQLGFEPARWAKPFHNGATIAPFIVGIALFFAFLAAYIQRIRKIRSLPAILAEVARKQIYLVIAISIASWVQLALISRIANSNTQMIVEFIVGGISALVLWSSNAEETSYEYQARRQAAVENQQRQQQQQQQQQSQAGNAQNQQPQQAQQHQPTRRESAEQHRKRRMEQRLQNGNEYIMHVSAEERVEFVYSDKDWENQVKQLEQRFGPLAEARSLIADPAAADRISGIDPVIKEMIRCVQIRYMNPQKREQYHLQLPSGLLFYGPPGTGKTQTTIAMADLFGICLRSVRLSELLSPTIGEPAAKIHQLFNWAREHARKRQCLVLLFFDELDAIGKRRDGGDFNRASDLLVGPLLQELGPQNAEAGVLPIAATNDITAIDPAIIRPGRFGTHLYFGPPDEHGRRAILENLLRNLPNTITPPQLEQLVWESDLLTGATLSEAVNKAAADAAVRNTKVTYRQLSAVLKPYVAEAEAHQRSQFGGRRFRANEHAYDSLLGIDPVINEIKKAVSHTIESYKKTKQKTDQEHHVQSNHILLYGPPGTGKTSLARATAQYFGCWFYVLSVQEVMSKWVGETERRVHALFEEARQNAPSIIFVDELDAIATERSSQANDTNTPSSLILPVLLTEIDGFERNQGVIVMGATNRLDIIDQALLRGGRFGQQIEVGLPDLDSREQLLLKLTRKANPQITWDSQMLETLARVSEGLAPGDMETAITKAAQQAQKAGQKLQPQDIRQPLEAMARRKQSRDPSVTRFSARRYEPDQSAFHGLFGVDEAIQQLRNAVRIAIQPPQNAKDPALSGMNGILLYGPPGVGKTALARATAQYFGCWFFNCGPQNLRSRKDIHELFEQARKKVPAIVFIDELDAIAGTRKGADYTLVQALLVELNGIDPLQRIVVIGATNLPDTIDPALLRGGRFGQHIEIGLPDEQTRRKLIQALLKDRALPAAIPQPVIDQLAAKTQGHSPADITDTINRAIRDSLIAGKARIDIPTLEKAFGVSLANQPESRMARAPGDPKHEKPPWMKQNRIDR